MGSHDKSERSSPDDSCCVVDAPSARPNPVDPPDLLVTTSRLRQSLLLTVSEHRDKRAMLSALSRIVSEHTSADATFYFERDESNALLPARLLSGDGASFPAAFRDQLFACSESACALGHITVNPIGGDAGLLAVSVPVCLCRNEPEVFTAVFSARGHSQEHLGIVLEIVAAHITIWHVQQDAAVAELEAQSAAALQEVLTKMEASHDLERACCTLVNDLQKYLGCHGVALALCFRRRNRSRVHAISGVQTFDRHSTLVSAIESALDEAILRDVLTVWPPVSPSDRHGALAHHRLCNVAGVPCVVSSPLRDQREELIGVWLFLGTGECLVQPEVLNLIRASESRIASCLSLLQRARGGPVRRLRRSLVGKKRTWKTKTALLALCAVVAALFLPVHYKIGCDCRLEPVSRRFVAAPYDGILQEALVSSGATVAAGDVLARMDGREIRWELAGITAERDRAVKQSDAAFANHKFAAAEVTKLEVDRLELKMQLLEHRRQNLNVKSPIGGVVTFGDLERAQGAPVKCGQTLFEIAPLTEMLVEVAIPEDEISYVRAGQQAIIHLEACPGADHHGTISKIHPRSEIRDHQNVFLAEVALMNSGGNLRPGMRGRAKIIGPCRTWAWNLFHKPWESLCLTFGW
ncbi:MAG: efflux RND transporter periplasmic adaptor subunit [Planctomycetota bacterium]|jgi:biotin carboxyl carrier protein